jgi:DNA-binding NtrC family response regulator
LSGNQARPVDDRCPFEVALAVIRTVGELDPGHPDEMAVLRDIVQDQGPASADYLHAIRRSRHSIFYSQLLRLFAYGRRRVPPEHREGFCFRCGQVFVAHLFRETLHPILRVAMGERGDFRATVFAMVRSYLHRYTGDRYRLETGTREDGLRFRLTWASPAAMREYLDAHGLDPATSLLDSAAFFAGAVEGFLGRIVEDFAPSGFRWSGDAAGVSMEVSLPPTARIAYDTLLQTLVHYAEDVAAARRSASAEELLENDFIVGSPAMRETWQRIRRASASEEIVLLLGESGTGKTELARRIHVHSRRREGPFVEVAVTSEVGSENMVQSDLFGHERGAFTGAGDLKEGLFTLADGGTIFLDEIGDATPELQAKLLRVLETSTFRRLGGLRDIRVDVRVIAATNRDLRGLVREGRFREDLFYRLSVIPIHLPPLRDRAPDLPALASFLLARTAARAGTPPRVLDPGAAHRLCAYPWPGNVRELDHALKYANAFAEGAVIGLEDLPEPLRGSLLQAPDPPGPASAEAAAAPASVVDRDALRAALRSGGPPPSGRRGPFHGDPRHIDHAKRAWLSTLIEEFDGDLALVARYWDRSSEKTLRGLVRSYGLEEALAVARTRRARA